MASPLAVPGEQRLALFKGSASPEGRPTVDRLTSLGICESVALTTPPTQTPSVVIHSHVNPF